MPIQASTESVIAPDLAEQDPLRAVQGTRALPHDVFRVLQAERPHV